MWATSIGSTFSHSPVPGERKSGIPEGTEIPAPVSATTEPASRISSASSRGLLTAVTWGRPFTRSLPLRRALAEEGADALLGVLGGERGGEALLLGLDALVEVALVRDLLDLLDRERRLAGELARPGERGVEQLVVGDHAVDQAELVGLVGGDRVADQVHLQRLGLADQPRQALGAAEAGDDPEVDLGLAEGGRLGGDAHVAGHRQLAAAAERQAVDGGDRDHRAGAAEGAQQVVALVEQLAPPASSIFVNALMSAPAQNSIGLDEAITSARTSPAPSTCSQTVPRSAITCGEIEFAGGLASQAIATSPRVSSLTVSLLALVGLRIGKKPWPALHPEPALGDQAAEDQRRREVLAPLGLGALERREHVVEADVVGAGETAAGSSRRRPSSRGRCRGSVGDALLEHQAGLDQRLEREAIDERLGVELSSPCS